MEKVLAHVEKRYEAKTEKGTIHFDSKKELLKHIEKIFSTHGEVALYYGNELITHQKKKCYDYWLCDELWTNVKEFAGIYHLTTDWSWLANVCDNNQWYKLLNKKSFYVEESMYNWMRNAYSTFEDLSSDYNVGDLIIDKANKDIVFKITKKLKTSLSVVVESVDNQSFFGTSYKKRVRYNKLNSVVKINDPVNEMPRSYWYFWNRNTVENPGKGTGKHYYQGGSLHHYFMTMKQNRELQYISY